MDNEDVIEGEEDVDGEGAKKQKKTVKFTADDDDSDEDMSDVDDGLFLNPLLVGK